MRPMHIEFLLYFGLEYALTLGPIVVKLTFALYVRAKGSLDTMR